jgi:hypothetical protein
MGEERTSMRTWVYSIGIFFTALTLTTSAMAAPKTVTWTGWFSDSQCALARAASGTFSATNPDCAKRCIQNGSAPAFISEQAQAVFTVKDYPAVVDDLGFRVEVVAEVDEAAKTLSIKKVTRLSEVVLACQRPRKATAKQ